MTADVNPYAPPPGEPDENRPIPFDPNQRKGLRRDRWAIGIAVTIVLGCLIASAVAAIDIESIVISGAALVILSLALLFLAGVERSRRLIPIGIAMILAAIGCFLTIYFNGWTPQQAQRPIGMATVVIALVMQFGWIPIHSVIVELRSENSRGGYG